MKGIPQGRYTKEFREEAVKLVTEGKMAIPAAAKRLSLPPSKQIIDYAKSQQSKRYKDPNKAPTKTLGKISIKCGITLETLWISWM